MLAFMTSEGLLILLGLKTGGEIDQLPSKPLEAKLFTEGEIDTGKRIRLCVGAIPQRDLEGHPTASDNIYFDYTPPGAGWLELERIEAIIPPQAILLLGEYNQNRYCQKLWG